MCVFFVMYILKNYLYTFLYLPDFWQCAYTVLIYFHYSFKMSLKEKVGGYWRVLCADSALSSAPHRPPPSMSHSPHSWGPSPPLGCSILCLNLSCFFTSLSLFPSDLFLSVTLSYFSSGSFSLLVSYLPLLFEKMDIHMKGQSNVTLHLVGFRQILPASGVLKKCSSWGRGQWRADF